MKPVLFDYWRSSASYRVRIALNLLGLEYQTHPVNLLEGAHRDAAYFAINPECVLPSLQIDSQTLSQSLAIIEYLHATTEGSHLLPDDVVGQYRVRQLSHVIAMEIHPVCNLSVVAHIAQLTGGGDAAKKDWMQHFIAKGLAAFEALLAKDEAGDFCLGMVPTIADCCLIPQLYNAQRWGVPYDQHVNITRIADHLHRIDAVKDAHPDMCAIREP
jgi:maleylacetoacetate isomerase